MNDFLSICSRVSRKYDISANSYEIGLFKRDEEEDITLELPFASTECWQMGATHFGALETEDSAQNGEPSSIDMAPSLFNKWGVPFDYLNSNGEIYSSHSGYFHKHSDCTLEILHNQTKFSTFYSHLYINDIVDGTFIEQGENIGRIQLDPDMSNCRCDWPSKSFLCATGPHLHLELRYDGEPASLKERTISNLRIHPGTLPHDMYCSDPAEDCTSATFQGKACATTYTDLSTGQVICPVTKGANIGRK